MFDICLKYLTFKEINHYMLILLFINIVSIFLMMLLSYQISIAFNKLFLFPVIAFEFIITFSYIFIVIGWISIRLSFFWHRFIVKIDRSWLNEFEFINPFFLYLIRFLWMFIIVFWIIIFVLQMLNVLHTFFFSFIVI